jgi:hypothetical protein
MRLNASPLFMEIVRRAPGQAARWLADFYPSTEPRPIGQKAAPIKTLIQFTLFSNFFISTIEANLLEGVVESIVNTVVLGNDKWPTIPK